MVDFQKKKMTNKQQSTQPEQPTQVFQDSWCNRIQIGEVSLQSPHETMQSLIDKTKELLKSLEVKSYLNERLIKQKQSGGSNYLG